MIKRQNWYLRIEKGEPRHSGPHWLPIQLYPHVSNRHRPRLYAPYADVSGANDAPRNSWRVSLSLSLSSSFPSISSPDREETFLENSSGGQWASFLAWRGNEGGGVERTPTSWRFDGIILYTREKKERNERKRGKKPKIRSKNWIIKPCVRERGTLHYHKYLRLDGRRSSQYKFESRVEGEKEKYLFIASRIFMFSKPRGGVRVNRWIRDIERERERLYAIRSPPPRSCEE